MAVNEIMNHYVRTFEANAIHLVQQKLSKFRRTVTEKSPTPTEKHSWRVVDARGAMTARTNMGANAGKRPATAYADTVFNDRVAMSTFYSTADSYAKPDLKRMLEDPQSEIYKAMVPQAGRTFDDVINTAFFAAALDSAANSNPWAGTALGGAAQAFNFAMVAAMLEAYNTDEVDGDEEKFFAIPPTAITAILSEPKATSVDYVNAQALNSGKIVQGWMGFTWIMSNRLTHPTGGQTYCPSWTRDSMGLLVTQDIQTDIGQDVSKQFDTTVQISIDIGAVRVQDKKVKRLHILG